jgi:O-methyltransferase
MLALRGTGGRHRVVGANPGDPAAAQLYLDLLKRCLLDTIHADDPLAGMVPAGVAQRRRRSRWVLRLAGALAARCGLRLVEPMRTPYASHAGLDGAAIRALREEGADWPPRAHTMVGRRRLDHVQACIETVLREDIPGDLMETGIWRGGCAILMRGVLAAWGDAARCVWAADSFRGLPPPEGKWPADAGSGLHRLDFLAVSRAAVEANFRAYGLLDERVRLLEGWFETSLPAAPVSTLAVLRLDGDMYGSTMVVLETMYDRLSPGGFLIIDDHSLASCRRAVADFRAAHAITEPIEPVDWTAVFWRKRG